MENQDLIRAKCLLQEQEYTCVVCCGERIFFSEQKGINPVVRLLTDGGDFRGGAAADRIVGKAAALLFSLAGVVSVYGEVMSRAAVRVLADHGIDYSYATLTDYIVNRSGDGVCPMECAVKEIDEPAVAFEAVCRTLQALRAQKG